MKLGKPEPIWRVSIRDWRQQTGYCHVRAKSRIDAIALIAPPLGRTSTRAP